MKQTLGILAHVDAGKTTLSERILYHANAIRNVGRVDDGSAHMDHSEIERERGITVFSDAARIECDGHTITLIDTPGHADFSAETERAISAMDYALLVVSAIDGVQSHTETVWRLLRAYNVPTFIFINKTDAATADADAAFLDIRERLSSDAVDFAGDFSEALAERDEALMEEFFEKGKVAISERVRSLISEEKVFPTFRGSALRDENIKNLIPDIISLMSERENGEKLSAKCYKVRREGSSRYVYLKINSGKLKVKDSVTTHMGARKIDEIRFPQGEKLVSASVAEAGEVCAVTGLSDIRAGDIIGEEAARKAFETIPIFSARVIHGNEISSREILEKMKILEDEENTLSVRYTESLDEIDISVMGKISLQVIEYEFLRRFGVKISFDTPRVVYRETIAEPIVGYGHFEPLRHYGEVHIKMTPSPRGSGISFKSEISGDILKPDAQRLIRTHVFEKAHKGVLTGGELTDIEYSLVAGAIHEKYTEGGDLRESTYRAIRQGLMRAKNILLEPMFSFEARSDMSLSGKIMSDVQKMGGEFSPPEISGDIAITKGRAPARLLSGYVEELISHSGGRAGITLRFDGYEPCREQEEIVAEIGYDPERDLENTPDSVFCAKGAGFTVKWYDAEKYMNLL